MAGRKEYYNTWTQKEIDDHLDNHNILVLFAIDLAKKEAELKFYGSLDKSQEQQLKILIGTLFGGIQISSDICNKINDFADKWYDKFVVKKITRVLNFKKEKNK